MKILLVLAIFMATLSSLSAQDSSQGSLRIDREIKQFTEGVKARSLSIARDVIKRVQASPTQFFDQFQTVQERIITRLNGLGPEGASIASNITNDIVSLSDRLKNEFSDGNLNSKAIQFLRNLETRSLKPISDSVESLKQAVDGNPKFIKCWDQNKGLLKQLINKTLRESVNIIQDILPNLKIRTDKWARRVIENIQNAEIYVEQNCSDVNCTADFVRFSSNSFSFL